MDVNVECGALVLIVYVIAFLIAALTQSFLLIFAFIGVVATLAFAIDLIRAKPPCYCPGRRKSRGISTPETSAGDGPGSPLAPYPNRIDRPHHD